MSFLKLYLQSVNFLKSWRLSYNVAVNKCTSNFRWHKAANDIKIYVMLSRRLRYNRSVLIKYEIMRKMLIVLRLLVCNTGDENKFA